MDTLSTLFERFLRERRYLKNVTPKPSLPCTLSCPTSVQRGVTSGHRMSRSWREV